MKILLLVDTQMNDKDRVSATRLLLCAFPTAWAFFLPFASGYYLTAVSLGLATWLVARQATKPKK